MLVGEGELSTTILRIVLSCDLVWAGQGFLWWLLPVMGGGLLMARREGLGRKSCLFRAVGEVSSGERGEGERESMPHKHVAFSPVHGAGPANHLKPHHADSHAQK